MARLDDLVVADVDPLARMATLVTPFPKKMDSRHDAVVARVLGGAGLEATGRTEFRKFLGPMKAFVDRRVVPPAGKATRRTPLPKRLWMPEFFVADRVFRLLEPPGPRPRPWNRPFLRTGSPRVG